MKKYLLPLVFIGIEGFSQNTVQTGTPAYTQKTEFPGGDEAFRKQFMNMLHADVRLNFFFRLPPDVSSCRIIFLNNK